MFPTLFQFVSKIKGASFILLSLGRHGAPSAICGQFVLSIESPWSTKGGVAQHAFSMREHVHVISDVFQLNIICKKGLTSHIEIKY